MHIIYAQTYRHIQMYTHTCTHTHIIHMQTYIHTYVSHYLLEVQEDLKILVIQLFPKHKQKRKG